MSPRFTPEARTANLALVDLLKRIAQRKQATPARMALGGLGWRTAIPNRGIRAIVSFEPGI